MEDPVDGPTPDRESSRAFLDGLLDKLPDPALFVDADATVLAANDALYTLLERPPATVPIPGCALASLLPDLSIDSVRAAEASGERVRTAVDGTDRVVEFAFER